MASLVDEIASAATDATVRVPAGTWPVNLVIRRSLTLIGDAGAILDGSQRGSVIAIDAPGARVKLVNLTVQHGAANNGGGVAIESADEVVVETCTIIDNTAASFGGGGLYAASKRVKLSGCTIQRNTARQGGGILVEKFCHLSADDTDVSLNAALEGAALRLRDGASVALRGCTIQDNKAVGDDGKGALALLTGTPYERPSLELVDVSRGGNFGGTGPEIHNEGTYPGRVTEKTSPLARARLTVPRSPR